MTADPIPRTVDWRRDRIRLIDQRALPGRLRFVTCATVDDVVQAIQEMVVRGAPALGATGAFGVALAARTVTRRDAVRRAANRIAVARPTAANLRHGVDHALAAFAAGGPDAALAAARSYADADVERNRRIGALGGGLLPDGATVLTHCNAGALACVGYGTALGVIRGAREQGRSLHVLVDETRPVLQGARLTAWELEQLGIPYDVLVDGAAGAMMRHGDVDAVVVGADRIAANGDVANKVGTYPLAVLARHHGVPFLVAAPTSTIDLGVPDGDAIVVEERDPAEVLEVERRRVTPPGARARNPAFDVTPARYVSAIVTEAGIARRPYARSIARAARAAVW